MSVNLTEVAQDSARGAFFLISGTILSTVIMAVASILIARLLGPELYGQYSLVLVVPQLLFLLTDLGINQGIIRFTANNISENRSYNSKRIIQQGLFLKIVIGTVISVVSYIFAVSLASIMLHRPELAPYVQLASIAVVFQVISTTIISAFVGLGKTEYNAIATGVQAIAKSTISISLVIIGLGVTGTLVGYVTGYIVAAGSSVFMLIVILHKNKTVETVQSGFSELKALIHYGTPLFVSSLLTGMVPLFQGTMLALFATDVAIGNYGAASNFITLITLISIPIATALLPAFSKLDSTSSQRIKAFFKLSNKYTTMIVLSIAFLLLLFSDVIVQIIYGGTYESAALFLSTYVLLYFLVGFGLITLVSFFNGLGETKMTLKMNLITFLATLILSPILTFVYGVLGLIIAFIVANATGTFYGCYIAKVRFKVDFDVKSMVKLYLVSILSAIPVVVMLQFLLLPKLIILLIGSFLYLVTFLTLIPAAKILSQHELELAESILGRIKLLRLIIMPLLKYETKVLGLLESQNI